MSDKWAVSYEPDELLGFWRQSVTDTECGYHLAFEDFMHELELRELLEDAVDSGLLDLEARSELRELDRRYMQSTLPSADRVWRLREWFDQDPRAANSDFEFVPGHEHLAQLMKRVPRRVRSPFPADFLRFAASPDDIELQPPTAHDA